MRVDAAEVHQGGFSGLVDARQVRLYQHIATYHPESQDCTLNREMKETKLKANSMSNHTLTQWKTR